jgi:flagellum-specific peptidoglycan hydrolase FlgJ
MRQIFKALTILATVLVLVSCGSKKGSVETKSDKRTEPIIQKSEPEVREEKVEETIPVDPTEKPRDQVEEYVFKYREIAMREMKHYGIPASITLAQGILESASGKGRLAKEANNHFGIKCHTGWTGPRIYHDDDSDQECFRVYSIAAESYEDHSIFLSQRKRYAFLFDLDPLDYEGWARGLRRAGYATDRRYPSKLISLIERYDLHKYDRMVGQQPARRAAQEVEPTVNNYTIQRGDTLYSIARRYGTTVEAIMRDNNLSSPDISPGQKLLIKSE